MEKVSSSNSQGVHVPKLRFPGFEGEWNRVLFSDLFAYLSNNTLSRAELSNSGKVRNIHYGDVLIKYGEVIDIEHTEIPYVADVSRLRKPDYLSTGDVVIADTAEDDTVGKAVEIINNSSVAVVSGLHTIPCRPKKRFVPSYLGYYVNSAPFHTQLHPYMQGIKVTSISKGNIGKTYISSPDLEEQQKITSLLNLLSSRIEKQRQLVEALKSYKRGALSKLFPKKGETVPEYRFGGFTEPWEQRKLGDILTTVPIQQFIKSPEQGGKHEIIQQGNDPIIGYANGNPCFDYESTVVFGDHTLSLYKPFNPFFVATDGVRIIKGKNGMAGYYLYSLLEKFKPQSEGYKRYYSILANTDCYTTDDLNEQKLIGRYCQSVDQLITDSQRKLDIIQCLKSGLLQQLFI